VSKAGGIVGVVFGLVLIFVAIGAYFSGEAASQESEGRMAIGLVIIFGLATIAGGLNTIAKEKEKEEARARSAQQTAQMRQPQPPTEQLPPPPPDLVPTAVCPSCGRHVQADFVVCPYCGKPTRASCPKCGKQVEKDFVACPYCGMSLKTG